MTASIQCRYCGERTDPVGSRRAVRHRNIPALLVPEEMPIAACPGCWSKGSVRPMGAELDAIQAHYQSLLRALASQTITALMDHISQRQLEIMIGLSHGYLCRLRSGTANPSAELVSHLAILAKDPSTRLQELREYWQNAGHCILPPSANEKNPKAADHTIDL